MKPVISKTLLPPEREITSQRLVYIVDGKEYSFNVWFEVSDFREIMALTKQNHPSPEPKKPISDKLIGIYRESIYKYLVIEENFKDCELSLLKMSLNLKIPQKYISHIVNNELGIGFCDYANYLRLRYFNDIKLFAENNIYTREAIARKCGFPSHATFYRTQKKFQDQELSFSL